MIHPLNIILLGIVIVLLFFSCKREGFDKIQPIAKLGSQGDGSIPPVPNDVICMILHSMRVPNINRMGVMSNKCAFDNNTNQKEDTDTCKY